MSGKPADLEAARQAKAELAGQLAGDERVAGIGIAPDGGGGYEVKVNLTSADTGLQLPAEVGGVPVRTEVVGEIRPL